MDIKIAVSEAVKTLKEGGVILYPTDTVWGLGCDATNQAAIEKIYNIKKRADSKSLIMLVTDIDMVCRYVKSVPDIALQLVEVTDTPLTIIYPVVSGLAKNAVTAEGTAGMRIPDHEFCQMMLRRFNKPIISTSANISGEPAPGVFDEIDDYIFGSVDYVVDREFEEGSTHKPSAIIKLGTGGEIEIIRK